MQMMKKIMVKKSYFRLENHEGKYSTKTLKSQYLFKKYSLSLLF
ncbi:hypothetical protein SAMN05421846_10267 [Chryseobacterium taeanense]|uniref:Uncharacterized protein n=1 Tax=Chryseobacterium taeanense TaxID=311334 RepID=A0A1G8FAF8_9FLAO|nr:hypothetical protein SAMN05421846_10267 [Chryseobacterium taeanense]